MVNNRVKFPVGSKVMVTQVDRDDKAYGVRGDMLGTVTAHSGGLVIVHLIALNKEHAFLANQIRLFNWSSN